MAPPDQVRPGSALATDPGLATALAGAFPRPEAGSEALRNAQDTWSLLAALPWQRFGYRWGRWQSEAVVWKALITFDAWESYAWQRNDETFQLLDPHTGKAVGELYGQDRLRKFDGRPYQRPESIIQPGGTLEFAGHPGTIGVYRLPGGGASTIRLSWNPWLNNEVLRDAIAGLRNGTADRMPPPYQFVDLDLLDKYRAWFTDAPNKPSGKAPWAAEARLYRPGGGARFGKSR